MGRVRRTARARKQKRLHDDFTDEDLEVCTAAGICPSWVSYLLVSYASGFTCHDLAICKGKMLIDMHA